MELGLSICWFLTTWCSIYVVMVSLSRFHLNSNILRTFLLGISPSKCQKTSHCSSRWIKDIAKHFIISEICLKYNLFCDSRNILQCFMFRYPSLEGSLSDHCVYASSQSDLAIDIRCFSPLLLSWSTRILDSLKQISRMRTSKSGEIVPLNWTFWVFLKTVMLRDSWLQQMGWWPVKAYTKLLIKGIEGKKDQFHNAEVY